MTRKTDGEKIDELQILVATLIERLDNTRNEMRNEMVDRAEFAVVQDRLNELRRSLEETARRRWSIWPAIVGALIGSVLALLGQIVIKHFMP